jgi:lysophospholipase L1-like esterase
VALLVLAGSAASVGATDPGGAARPILYLALGDSLSAGIQPDADGHNHRSGDGYADQVARKLGLQLVRLGCGGTVVRLTNGEPCTTKYGKGSQLQQAEAMLRRDREDVALITVNIGDNDVEGCMSVTRIDDGCVTRQLATVRRYLPAVARRLRAAAGKKIPVVGIADYDQFLAAWRKSSAGRRLARHSVNAIDQIADAMHDSYVAAGALFTDAGPDFSTHDWSTGKDGTPRNVKNICALTWACSGPPVGFNDHARTAGYAVIARDIRSTLRRVGFPGA